MARSTNISNVLKHSEEMNDFRNPKVIKDFLTVLDTYFKLLNEPNKYHDKNLKIRKIMNPYFFFLENLI